MILYLIYIAGIGTIGIFASKYVKKVYGIEIVKEAIEDAKANAKINNIKNIEFFVGDTKKVLKDLIEEKQILPDVVFIDPPRKGLENISIQDLIECKPKKIIYISCNPSTLVRDLSKLEKEYKIMSITPVDLFPFTSNVECVAVLQLNQDM